jgi:phage-related protein
VTLRKHAVVLLVLTLLSVLASPVFCQSDSDPWKDFYGSLENAKNTVVNAFTGIGDWIWSQIRNIFSSIASGIRGAIDTIAGGVVNAIKEIINLVVAPFRELYNAVLNWFSGLNKTVQMFWGMVQSNPWLLAAVAMSLPLLIILFIWVAKKIISILTGGAL